MVEIMTTRETTGQEAAMTTKKESQGQVTSTAGEVDKMIHRATDYALERAYEQPRIDLRLERLGAFMGALNRLARVAVKGYDLGDVPPRLGWLIDPRVGDACVALSSLEDSDQPVVFSLDDSEQLVFSHRAMSGGVWVNVKTPADVLLGNGGPRALNELLDLLVSDREFFSASLDDLVDSQGGFVTPPNQWELNDLRKSILRLRKAKSRFPAMDVWESDARLRIEWRVMQAWNAMMDNFEQEQVFVVRNQSVRVAFKTPQWIESLTGGVHGVEVHYEVTLRWMDCGDLPLAGDRVLSGVVALDGGTARDLLMSEFNEEGNALVEGALTELRERLFKDEFVHFGDDFTSAGRFLQEVNRALNPKLG